MVQICSDARFSDVEIFTKQNSLLYIDGIPLIKKIDNKYYLNLVQRNTSGTKQWILGSSENAISRLVQKSNDSRIENKKQAPKVEQTKQIIPITNQLNSLEYIYRGDVVAPFGTISSLDALTILQLSVGMMPMSSISGREHLAFTYGSDLPSVWDGVSKPTSLDALTTLYYAVKKPGYENPIVFATLSFTPTQTTSYTPTETYISHIYAETPTVTKTTTTTVTKTPTATKSPYVYTTPNNASVHQLDNNWTIEVVDGNVETSRLYFIKNNTIIASIIPSVGTEHTRKYSVINFNQNREKLLSSDWSIYYPEPYYNATSLTENDKQLKFMYKNYIQTTIIPQNENVMRNKTYIDNRNFSLGTLWEIFTDSDSLEFYYRENVNSYYYSQLYIGNHSSNQI